MDNFKSYSFSRLINLSEVEFFYILGLVKPDDFNEIWDLTGHKVVGYLVMYKKHKRNSIKNIIYLLPDFKNEHEDIKRYTDKFIKRMISADMYDYEKEIKIKQTKVKGDFVGSPYVDFVKEVVGNDIPKEIFQNIRY